LDEIIGFISHSTQDLLALGYTKKNKKSKMNKKQKIDFIVWGLKNGRVTEVKQVNEIVSPIYNQVLIVKQCQTELEKKQRQELEEKNRTASKKRKSEDPELDPTIIMNEIATKIPEVDKNGNYSFLLLPPGIAKISRAIRLAYLNILDDLEKKKDIWRRRLP